MQEINLYHLLKFYAKNWMIILVLTTLGVVSGFVYNNYIQKPLYESNATLLLVNPTDKTSTQSTTSINNYVQLFKSRRVLEPVIEKQTLDTNYDDLVNSVSATNQKDTQVIEASINTNNPFDSTAFIDGAIASFKKQATELYGVDNVQVVDDASFSATPTNVHTEIQLTLATAAGFIVSIIVLFFVYDIKLSNKSVEKVAVKKVKTVKKITKKPKATKTK